MKAETWNMRLGTFSTFTAEWKPHVSKKYRDYCRGTCFYFPQESRNLASGALITVTVVAHQPDMSVAKVYLSFSLLKTLQSF